MVTFVEKRTPCKARYFTEYLGDGIGIDMILIPGGRFLMGSTKEEAEREKNEGPQHEVTVSAFCMGRYPVTQAQWKIVAEQFPQQNQTLKSAPSRFKGENRPVEQVSWDDAVEFCDRLSARTKRTYRLPSEAEWEYACRAGTETPFYFGKTISTDVVNYDGNYFYGESEKTGVYREETTPVTEFDRPNEFGLVDMHGNVYEWCLDHWHDDYQGAPEDGRAWVTGGDSDLRILRGGSWFDDPRDCRSADRYRVNPGARNYDFGFRLVLSLPRTSFPSSL